MRIAIGFSGGLDSTVLAWDLAAQGNEVRLYTVDYGQTRREIEHANSLGPIELIRCDIAHGNNVVIPGRNLIIIGLLANRAVVDRCDAVALATCASDCMDFPDCRGDFRDSAGRACRVYGVEAIFPYAVMYKSEILRRGREIGAPVDATWSCYGDDDLPCGVCLSCKERNHAYLEEI